MLMSTLPESTSMSTAAFALTVTGIGSSAKLTQQQENISRRTRAAQSTVFSLRFITSSPENQKRI